MCCGFESCSFFCLCYLTVIASGSEAIQRSMRGALDCFVALLLAMTSVLAMRLHPSYRQERMARTNGKNGTKALPSSKKREAERRKAHPVMSRATHADV